MENTPHRAPNETERVNPVKQWAYTYHAHHQPSIKMEEYGVKMHAERMTRYRRMIKATIMGIKIGIGSAAAILLATAMGLQSPTAAGTITLLTLANTKKDTISLIGKRFVTFFITALLCLFLFNTLEDKYVAFMIFLAAIVFITEILGWGSTLSVNALIGMHCLDQKVLDPKFLLNEFVLLCLGVFIAFLLNQFYAYRNMRIHMFACRRASEKALHEDLQTISRYLLHESDCSDLRHRLEQSEKEDERYLKAAKEYAGNFYSKAPECYINYFQMRLRQQVVLRTLFHDLKMLRNAPEQAQEVAHYIETVLPFIGDIHPPQEQMEKLDHLIAEIRSRHENNPLDPESKAVYYHILLCFRDLMLLKVDFIKTLTPEEKALFFRDLSYQPDPAQAKS